jgi:hypothetical protein
MFAAVIFLREKTRIVHISPYKQPQARIVSKLKVYLPSTELEQKKAVIVNKETKRAVTPYDQTQYIINGKQEAFVKFNGLWYQYVSGRFERVKQPEYS